MLHIHRAERADGLVDALGALLSEPLPDPLAPEVVAVPTRGIERWLAQRMSSRLGAAPGSQDGVCANVAFPSPRRLVSDAVAAASGVDPDTDPWRPERLVWPLLEIVDASAAEPWLRTLAAHLDGTARRFTAVRHVAELLDRYALHRPDLVRTWSEGADGGWQAELWRRLRERIAAPDPVERIEGACARLASEPGLLDLPPRLGLFGLTRLPAARLRVLCALAASRDIHLFLLHPSPVLWDRVAADEHAPVVRRAQDPTAQLAVNRLLGSWGQDVRELQLVLEAAGGHADHHHATAAPATGLLAAVQADVRANRDAAGAPLPTVPDVRPQLEPGDRSIEIHACHGRARQVEVLRDAVLHVLADDPTLEPRDVIVMCPDIEAFAPLIHATFGAGTQDDRGLHVRLADRALRQTNPVLGVVARLLELAGERLTASQVLDLADRPPVRRRFRLGDDDLARIEDWVRASGIRWGLDATDREPFKLDTLAAGTWRAGVDRVLVGVTMAEEEERLFAGVLPLDDVDSGDIDLAGRLAELVERLGAAFARLRAAQPIAAWAEAIAAATDALTATSAGDAWQRAELARLLDDVVAEASTGEAVHAGDLVLGEIRALLGDRLAGRPTRANFRTGHLTVCTLVPMRSVPHRVVCLLGLDDALFPRKAARDGDDLLLDDPHVGERDARLEDRQLLLDALMAATDRLLVTYTGNDERTNVPCPPAVPVGELLDVLERTVRVGAGTVRDRVVVRHPLQPFDPRNFTRGALIGGRAWSFDAVTLDGALALAGPRAEAPPFLAAPLDASPTRVIALDDLVHFAERPVRAFLRGRLGVRVARDEEEPGDGLPVELDALERWGVGQRLLEARLAGAGLDAALAAEAARGMLPPGRLGDEVIEQVRPTVETLVRHAETLRPAGGERSSVDVRVALADGRMLGGTVAGVSGDRLLAVNYSRLDPRHRLAAWVRLLALAAAHPDRSWEAITVGRPRRDARDGAWITSARIAPLPRGAAAAHLAVLVDLVDRGMREPLPLACRTSAAYARAVRDGTDPLEAARREWESDWNFAKEDAEPEHLLVLGGRRTLAERLAESPRPDETWEGDQASRFGRYSCRLWAGLLACELVVDR